MDSSRTPTRRLRSLILFVLLLGVLGTGVELVLLEHMEDWWQRTPLIGLGTAAVVVAWNLLRPDTASLRALQVLMALFIAIGTSGLVLHFRGNVEFELELHSTMRGFELVWESLRGATPALAPGAMIWLGLLGLVACHRHPVFGGDRETRDEGSNDQLIDA